MSVVRACIVETTRPTRRSWAVEEKRRIVEERLLPGASVATVARRHDNNASLLFSWRRQAHLGGRGRGSVSAMPAPAEFVPIGVFDRAAYKGPAMVALHAAGTLQGSQPRSPGRAPKLDERPGVIDTNPTKS